MSIGSIHQPILLHRIHDGVLTLTLNRPDKLNALDQAMVDALHAAVEFYAPDPNVRVVVITGAGERAFAAGADISQLRERTRADALRGISSNLFHRIAHIPVPTIAAVRGFALGGGCELAVACDLRIVGESAQFGHPETGLGIMAAAGATYRLPRLVGQALARELLFTGRLVDAAEALRIGLVNQVVADVDVLTAAQQMATMIAGNDTLATRLTKLALDHAAGDDEAARLYECTAQAVLFESPEKFRRMDAFLARKGRKA